MPRHTEPYRNTKVGYNYMFMNGTPVNSYPALDMTFESMPDLVVGNRRSPNPWWFKKTTLEGISGSTRDDYLWRDYGSSTHETWGNYGVHEQGQGGTIFGIDKTDAFSFSDDTALYNKALGQLYDEIKQNDFNLAVFMGEAPEMLKLKRQLSSDLGRLQRLAKGPLKHVSYLAAGSWLTWKYAVSPVLSDIEAITNYVRRIPETVVFAKGRARSVVRKSDTTRYAPLGKINIDGSLVHKFRVSYVVEDPTLFELSRFGLTNPALIVWELIPLSFVVDWFFDIGSYLQNLEASLGLGLRFQDGYHTRSHSLDKSHVWNGSVVTQDSGDLKVITSANLRGNYSIREMNRSTLASFPRPRIPIPRCDLGSQQLLSAAALLRTIFLK